MSMKGVIGAMVMEEEGMFYLPAARKNEPTRAGHSNSWQEYFRDNFLIFPKAWDVVV